MRILQIQGLRAFAAIVVTLFHAHMVPGGFIGVDVFYVISGYLITGLILREIENTGRLDLAAFYQRRIKRLLPTSVFVLFITALVGWFVLPAVTRDALGRDLFAAATYVSNYLFAWWQNDYQNLDATPSPFIHYWSLAVEEQFYLVWPIFIVFLARKGKRAIIAGISVATIFSFLLSVYEVEKHPIWAFYSLPTRAWELGIGALLLFVPAKLVNFRVLPWIGCIALAATSLRFNDNTAFPGFNALLPVSATALLIASIPSWPPIFNDLSNNRLAQWLGKISYPLYLWHWPALVLPSSALGRSLHAYERLICIATTILLAHLTNIFVEERFRHLPIRPKKIYLFAISTTIASLLAGLVIASTASSTFTISGDQTFTFKIKEIVSKPLVYGDGCHVNYGETKSGLCTYGDKKAAKTIVLYGDSHAAQWFPAMESLARAKGFRLISLTKSACPSVDSPRPDKGAFKESDCEAWRKNSVARIQKIKPLAVIVSSFQYYTPKAGSKNRDQWWSDGQQKLLTSLNTSTKHLVYISDTPHPTRDIPSCVSAGNIERCDGSSKSEVKIVEGFKVIDPTPWLCKAVCRAVVNSTVAYRDASHISVAMSLKLEPKLQEALKALGVFS